MRLALTSGPADPEFAPEPFSRLYQRSIYQSSAGLTKKAFLNLAKRLGELPAEAQEDAKFVLENQQKALKLIHRLTEKKLSGGMMRIHGNYSLSQALFTGKDFVIKDFEGDPEKPIGQRRIKRSPLRDAAGMLLSFYYAAHAPFLLPGEIPRKDMASLAPWTELWYAYTGGAFLRGCLAATEGSGLLSQSPEEVDTLLRVFLAEKAMLALDSEISARPDWVSVPAKLLRRLLRAGKGVEA